MPKPIIYDIERKMGIASIIERSNASKATAISIGYEGRKNKSVALKMMDDCEDEDITMDVVSTFGILVSTNWNKNDDIFTREETWKARNTPMFKPANMEHRGSEFDGNEIIGVITDVCPVDDEYEEISDSKCPDKSFHLAINTKLWRAYFPSTVSQVLAKIDAGTQFMSMECLFSDFGYGLCEKGSDDINLVPRNEMTAGLSSYLRCYGGDGIIEIEGKMYRIGRWLKDFTFSGVGYVDVPANEESITFDKYKVGTANLKLKSLDFSDNFIKLLQNCVLNKSNKVVNLWPNLKSN